MQAAAILAVLGRSLTWRQRGQTLNQRERVPTKVGRVLLVPHQRLVSVYAECILHVKKKFCQSPKAGTAHIFNALRATH
jgi:hypothetical protein